jgi:hypothetical protein
VAPKRQLGAMAAAVAAESDSELAARLQRELNSLRGTRVRPACISDGVPGAPLGSCGAAAGLVARRPQVQTSDSSGSESDEAADGSDEEARAGGGAEVMHADARQREADAQQREAERKRSERRAEEAARPVLRPTPPPPPRVSPLVSRALGNGRCHPVVCMGANLGVQPPLAVE